jgi:DeoR family fructose operon transcriptional repressor
MLAETRRLQIIDQLTRAAGREVSVADLSQQLGVSEMTIRRDLDWLAEKNLINRVHGGALLHQSDIEKPFGDRLTDFSPQKKDIGWAAAQWIHDGDRIILDAGTTTQQIAHHLSTKLNLTIITNNLPIAEELARATSLDTILLGGSLKHRELCTVGPMVTQALAQFTVDKLFLSAAGFAMTDGASDQDWHEVEVKQAMIRSARQVILVADSSKLGRTRLVKIAPIQAIQVLVTDNDMPASAILEFETAGIAVWTPERAAQHAVKKDR